MEEETPRTAQIVNVGPAPQTTWKRGQCRYGQGCTHISDEAHCARYWHPETSFVHDPYMSSYVCNECGFTCDDPRELKLHLQRKTAWSNQSLVGCHISVLLDNRDWQDGVVTQFHKSGKHYVEFQLVNQKRLLHMLKTAFYIIERPFPEANESKEAEADGVDSITHDHNSLAPLEYWTFCDEVTLDYAIAQSTIHRIYGNKIQETGHRTLGHLCVTDDDRKHASSTRGSLLYGELLPRGVNRALDSKHLCALRHGQQSLLDLGMGTGKVVLQVFLQCPNLTFVYGVELSLARFRVAQAAGLRLVETELMDDGTGLMIKRFEVVEQVQDHLLRIKDNLPIHQSKHTPYSKDRFLCLEWNNLLETTPFIGDADMVLLETDIPSDTMLRLACLLYQMKPGARILSYLDLSKVWDGHGGAPFTQLEVNKSLVDRFPTSWSVHRGHHFFLWVKTGRALVDMFSYYTNQRRIPADAPPPYPPHSASMIRSMMTSSTALTAGILGGVGSSSSSSSSSSNGATTNTSTQPRSSSSYSCHRHSSSNHATSRSSTSSSNSSSSAGGSGNSVIQPHSAESLNVRLERALSAPGTSLDSSSSSSSSFSHRKVRGDKNDSSSSKAVNKCNNLPDYVATDPNTKRNGRHSFSVGEHRHHRTSRMKSKSFSSKPHSSNCLIM